MKDSTAPAPVGCKRLPPWALELAMLDKSIYHASVFELFLLEFHPQAWEPYTSSVTLQTLQKARYTASCRAVLYKLAWSFIAVSCPGNEDGYPRVWLNEAQLLTTYPSLNAADRPYYLWDAEKERTVTVNELPECPQYVCISHTWGRWRVPGSYADINGVPWPVPQNTRFIVQDLPLHFKGLGFPYIWFDLFCIPQLETSKLKDQEIGRQAGIFRRSQRCIAWITDAESWDGVVSSLRWLGLNALKLTSTVVDEQVNEMWPVVSAAARASIELMRETPFHSHAVAAATDDLAGSTASPMFEEPVPWFSSLWTLQECFLCPEIQLYTKQWGRLEDSCGDAITLQALMVFIAENERYYCVEQRIDVPLYDGIAHNEAMWDHAAAASREWSGPRGVNQLLRLCRLTRLDNILTAGMPTALLTNSNLRQCTSSRAPAIMSALGVTDWHKRRVSHWRYRVYEQMVFGMFPLDFVREAAAKLGAIFFESTSVSRQSPRHINGNFWTTFLSNDSLGTMLPFRKKQGWFSDVTGSYNHHFVSREDHPGVSTWVICSNGSVNIPHAGISMASDDSHPYEKVSGLLHCYFFTGQGPWRLSSIIESDDLHVKLKDVAQDDLIVAVALWADYYYQHGMLLQKLPYSSFGRDCYIKVGGYVAKELPMPPSTPVRWKVL
ncbi:hypothetical protein VMCG_09927 [Cytospora schulzeri]|uniref:Heterokaryon incompatibility domain-containing protein n=1 Tax=Cytospora schulzeri TaxID=448051 RepID=A0A423VF25_9PEZI|nr:hypothetical protein VMCG_09927 [Valsa malicola]